MFPQILGDIGALATKGMRIPRVGAKTPPMLPPGLKQPSGAGMSGPLPEPTLSSGSPRPDQPDQPDENTGSGGILPMPQSLKQPPMTPGMQQLSDLYKQGAPPAATGVRGKIGGVFNALGWNWAGNPLKYPGLDVYQGQLARAQGLSNVEDEALKRQEAQQRIAESTENMRAMRDYRQNVALDKAQGTYDRRMENVQKAGGFEAPSVPPSTDRVEMPPNPLTSIPAGSGMQGPDESDVVRNLPQRNLILSPGLQPEQSSSLGTVENLKDPSSGETTPMVRPNLKTQQEMAQGAMPKVTPEMAASLSDIGLTAGAPVPKEVYNSYLKLIEQRTKEPAKNIPRDVEQRTQIADQLGLKGSERTRYIATGQMSDPEASATRRAGQQDREDNQSQNRSDKSYQFNVGQLNGLEKPVSDLNARFGRLRDTLAQGTPQADALVAPELLTVMAGGQGSGLRMNEAEIARIVGGRSNWEGLKAAINQWQIDPTKANTITPAQRQQIHALVDAVGKKLQSKQAIFDQAQQDLQATDDPKEHRRVVARVRQAITQVDGGITQLPNGGGKVIDPATAQQFYQAAGGDPTKARQLATQNGWKVQ